MKTLLITSLILCLTACTGPAKKSQTLPDGLTQITPASSLACRFEKQISGEKNPRSSSWYFWRETQRTETRDERSNQGEIWTRTDTGQFYYTRLFYNERVALEFVPGDLAATGAAPSWRQLTSLVNPDTLGKELTLLGKDTSNGMAVEYYSGTINSVETQVDWLPALQLPARMVKKLPDNSAVTLTLSDCGQDSKFPVKPITKPELDHLRHIDYTDLGDMEDDPMIHHLEQLMGGHDHGQH